MIDCKYLVMDQILHSVIHSLGIFPAKGVAVERARVHEILTNTAYCSHNGSYTMSPSCERPRDSRVLGKDIEHPECECGGANAA